MRYPLFFETLIEFLNDNPDWYGTTSELLTILSRLVGKDKVAKCIEQKQWPNNPESVAYFLNESRTALREHNFDFIRRKSNGKRQILFYRLNNSSLGQTNDNNDIVNELDNLNKSCSKTQHKNLKQRNIINTDCRIHYVPEIDDLVNCENKIKNSVADVLNYDLKVGFICDLHLGHHDQNALSLALSYFKKVGIHVLVLGGDILDFESVSPWKNSGTLSLKDEILLGRELLSYVREFIGKEIEIYWIEGNHCERLERYIFENAYKLNGLDELKVSYLLRADKYGVKWINNYEMLQKTGQPFRIGKLHFLHGHELKLNFNLVNFARSAYLKTLGNIIFGHLHATQEYIQRGITGNTTGAWAVGCMCNLIPDYRPINNWNQGFALIEFDNDGNFLVYNRRIINGILI